MASLIFSGLGRLASGQLLRTASSRLVGGHLLRGGNSHLVAGRLLRGRSALGSKKIGIGLGRSKYGKSKYGRSKYGRRVPQKKGKKRKEEKKRKKKESSKKEQEEEETQEVYDISKNIIKTVSDNLDPFLLSMQTHNKTETGFPAPEGKEWYWFYGKLRLRDKSDHMMEPEEEDGEVNGEEGWEEEEWWQEEEEQEDEKMYD